MILQTGLMKSLKKRLSSKGFTLIELFIVSVIILVLISISTPLFRKTFADMELKETASRLERFIAFAQQEAIINVTVYRMFFDFENKTYQLFVDTGEEGVGFEEVRDKFGRIFNLPKGISIEGTAEEILFYPDGHSDKVELTLTNENDKTLKATTTGILGNVIIAEEE